jgi:glutamyl-Q tRNA(Asp) synthetase
MKSRSASSTDDSGGRASGTAETGRFAPSPTGPLHLGSLLTAVASWINVRASGGRWLVRMEDLDEPRCIAGAADSILRTLERHGLSWDELTYQRDRIPLYRDALERLRHDGHTFTCICSRSQLQDADVYPGTCRNRHTISTGPSSQRVRVPNETLGFEDLVQGHYSQRLDRDVGDFIVFRRDGIVAYQLAVVVDDAAQHVTQVVRGADLLDNTPRQLLLFRLLELRPPRYAHVPVLADRSQQKLSKHTQATAIDARLPTENLSLVLALLGHEPPKMLRGAQPGHLLDWAVAHWRLDRVPRGIVHPDFVCI